MGVARSIPEVIQTYDKIAEDYDTRYTDETCRLENELVAHLVRDTIPRGSTVFDVGCGTGLALELGLSHPAKYVGIDPSAGMLKRFAEKFPWARTKHLSFEEWSDGHPDETFDGLISLFGSCSYFDGKYTERLFELAPNLVLMHYVEGYWPDYEPKPVTEDESRDTARKLTHEQGGEVLYLNHFQISILKRS